MSSKLTSIITIVFVFLNFTLTSLSYGFNNDYYSNNNNYRCDTYQSNYNKYTTWNTFNFKPSDMGLFTINIKDKFNNNSMYDGLRNSWKMNERYSKIPYSDNYNTYVAPNIEPVDYCGTKIKDNASWGSFNYGNNKYEPQLYSKVTIQDNKTQSFDVLVGKDNWNTRNSVNNISYNENNLPEKISMTTYDVAGNKFTQNITNIKYQENPQSKNYDDLMNTCNQNNGRQGYYMWDELKTQMETYSKPAQNVVKSFDMEIIDTQNNITNMKFENIKWDNKGITGYDAKVMDGTNTEVKISVNFNGTSTNGFNVELMSEGHTQTLANEKMENILTDKFKDKPNPKELMNGISLQVGDAKIPLMSVKYDKDALLDKGQNQFKIDFSIDKNSNNDKNKKVENNLRNEIFQLSKTDQHTTKEVIWNKDLNTANKTELNQIKVDIQNNIETSLAKFKNQDKIETAWGETLTVDKVGELKLDGNKIKTDIGFQTKDKTYTDVSFVIKDDKLMIAGAKVVKPIIVTPNKVEPNGVEQYISSPKEVKLYAPIKDVDVGNYDTVKMMQYAKDWYNPGYKDGKLEGCNPKYDFIPKTNCANYVSQCLIENSFPLKEGLNQQEVSMYVNPTIKGNTVISCDNLNYVLTKNPDVTKSFIKFSDEYIKKGKQDFYNQEVFKNVKVGDVIIFGRKNDEFAHASIVTKIENGTIFISANTTNWNNQKLSCFFTLKAYDRAYIYNINKERSY